MDCAWMRVGRRERRRKRRRMVLAVVKGVVGFMFRLDDRRVVIG